MTPKIFAREALASLVVFLVALPLCMGIAIASGVDPALGLVSGIIGGLVVGFFAGSPLQVSGPAAGLAVIVWEIVHTHGIEALGPAVFVGGLLQMGAARLGAGVWFRAVAPAVLHAMLAGIGVLIFASQFHVMVDDTPASSGLTNLMTIPGAVYKGIVPVDGSPHHLAAGIGVLTLLILLGWNLIRDKVGGPLRHVPAALVAVTTAAVTATVMGLPIAYVEVPGELASLVRFPALEDMALLTQPAIFGSAIALGIIASAESLLCAAAVDKIHDGPRSNLNKELMAQGIGNAVAGMLGALPITGVIVRSTANVEAGAKTRWSAVMHGAWLLGMVAMVPFVLERVPVSALGALLVYIGMRLVRPSVMRELANRGRAEIAVYVITVVAIVATNLLEGLLVGVVLSIGRLAWMFSHLEIETEKRDDGGIDVWLSGSATFVRLPELANSLDALPADIEVHVHLDHLDYIDHANLEHLRDWERERTATGGKVFLEWSELHARSQKEKPSRSAA